MNDIVNAIIQASKNSDNLTAITDKDGKIAWVNAAFTTTTGYLPEEVIGENPKILKSGLHDKEFYKTMWDSISSKKQWKGIITNKKKDGSNYRAMTTIYPVLDSKDEIEGYISIEQDMSLHDSLNEEVVLSEKKLLMAFDVAEVAMFLLTIDGKFLQVNRTACEMLGYDKEELLGMNFKDITHPSDKERSLEILHKMYENHSVERYSIEKRYLKKDGNILIGKMGCVIARDVNGTPLFLISQIQDLTKEKRLESETKIYADSLAAANKIFRVISEISEFAVNQEIFNLKRILNIAGTKLGMSMILVQNCNEKDSILEAWFSKTNGRLEDSINNCNNQQVVRWVSNNQPYVGEPSKLPDEITYLSNIEEVKKCSQLYVFPMKIKQRAWGEITFINGNGHLWSSAEQDALWALSRLITVMIEGNWEKTKLLEHISLRFDEIENIVEDEFINNGETK